MSLDALQDLKTSLIRKALSGSVFIAADGTALPTSLTTSSGTPVEIDLTPLPEEWQDLGYLSKDDGATWSRATNLSEVTSWGALEATRSDINSDVTSLAVTAQETKLLTLELYENIDLSGVTPDATTGEVAFSKPTRPSPKFYRLFAISQDGDGDDAIYIGKLCPRAQVTEVGDQTWSDGDTPITYPLTFSAKVDAVAGYSLRYFFGGPGWKAALADMGFTAAAGA
jgi:hypothetical protein